MSFDNLSIKIEKSPKVHIPAKEIYVDSKFGKVRLAIDQKVAEFTTIIAHKVGMAIFKAKLDYNDLIVLEINKVRFEMLPAVAKRVATKLLLRADDADDWQIINRR